MTEVPEGQVPRDEAFWRTYEAVQAEHHRTWAILQCEREGHNFSLSENRCVDCGMDYDEAMQRMGAVEEDGCWVFRAPQPGDNPAHFGPSSWTITP